MFKKTTQYFNSSKPLVSLLLLFALLTVTSCQDGFDKYWKFEEEQQGLLFSKLQEEPRFSSFVRALERTGISNTLNKAGVYTVFAPTNEAFQAFFTARGTTMEQIPEAELTAIVNYHIMYFTYYQYDFQRRFKASSANISYLNRSYKYLEITTDINSLETFRVNGVNVSMRDVQAENGVIHGIDQVLSVPANVDQTFNTRTEFSTLDKLLDVVADETADPRNTFDKNGDGLIDSTFIKYHRYLAVTGNPVYLDLEFRPAFGAGLGVQQRFTALAPVNTALDAYLNKKQYDNKSILERYGNDPSQLPLEYVGFLLQPHFLENNNFFNWNQVISPTAPLRSLGGLIQAPVINPITNADLAATNLRDIRVSNGYIHGINRVLESERIQSALGQALVEPDLRTFIRGMIRTGLFGTYAASQAANTIFAPTNQAFIDAKIDVENLTLDGATITINTLRNILAYHIINSEKRKAGTGTVQLTSGPYSTIYGRYGLAIQLTVDVIANTVATETGGSGVAKITQYDLRGRSQTGTFNSTTIHKIDKVLVPDLTQ